MPADAGTFLSDTDSNGTIHPECRDRRPPNSGVPDDEAALPTEVLREALMSGMEDGYLIPRLGVDRTLVRSFP